MLKLAKTIKSVNLKSGFIFFIISSSTIYSYNTFANKQNPSHGIAQELKPQDSLNKKLTNLGIATKQINIDADTWVVFDKISKQVIDEKNINQRIALDNFTRLALIYLLFNDIQGRKIKAEDYINIPKDIAVNINKQRGKDHSIFNINNPIKIKDIILSSLINDNKDSNLIMAYILGSDSIIDNLNKLFEQLKMTNTNCQNILGVSHPSNYTTLSDVLILISRLIDDYPQFSNILSEKSFSYNNIKYSNKNYINDIDKDINFAISGKVEDKNSLIIYKKRKEDTITHQDREVVTITIGKNNLDRHNQANLNLINYAFVDFDTIKIYEAKQVIKRTKVWLGEQDKINIGIKNSVFITLPKGMNTRISTLIDQPKHLYAPINAGAELGEIKLMQQNKEIYSTKLYALEEVKESSFSKKLMDKLYLLAFWWKS